MFGTCKIRIHLFKPFFIDCLYQYDKKVKVFHGGSQQGSISSISRGERFQCLFRILLSPSNGILWCIYLYCIFNSLFCPIFLNMSSPLFFIIQNSNHVTIFRRKYYSRIFFTETEIKTWGHIFVITGMTVYLNKICLNSNIFLCH